MRCKDGEVKQNITRITKQCRTPKCPNVTANYDGFCDECLPEDLEETYVPNPKTIQKDYLDLPE